MTLSVGSSLGPYEIVGPLGAGGMGEVYRARDPRMGREVAIKVTSDRFSDRLEKEVRAEAAMNHPNICQIYDVGPNYLVMELVEGPTLADHIQRTGALPVEEALALTRQICGALEAAHDKGIVHRDLKPANIKVKCDGVVKVLDFGLAKLDEQNVAGHPEESPTLALGATLEGQIVGTAAYMAPEQARGKPVDKRADIWAFGAVLYEILTGVRPFEHETISDTLAALLLTEPDWRLVPFRARRLVQKCLEKDPKNRLRDIGDAWSLLEAQEPRQEREPRRFQWGGWIAAAVLAVLAPWPWLVKRERQSEPRPVTRLEVDLGGDVALNSAGRDVIISPHGSRLVYLSHGRLFSRPLDQLAAKELPGTLGASSPFFSPDGKWIGYFKQNRLRKISVEGGVPIDVCETIANFTGADWGDDGNIIASLAPSGPLYRVDSRGGVPAAITQLDPARKEVTHRFPKVLPGSKAVIFTSGPSTTGLNEANIDVMTFSDHRRKTLVRGGSFGTYLQSGHLVYVNRGVLYAVAFDVDKLETHGAAVAIQQVDYSDQFGSARMDVSNSGTLIYGAGAVSSVPKVYWLDRDGKIALILNKATFFFYPRISPDGRRILVAGGEGAERGQWVFDPQQETMTRLTFSDPIFSFPLWTPDGRFIVYRDPAGINWTRSDGTGSPKLLVPGNEKIRLNPSSITADGKWLAFHAQGEVRSGAGNGGIWTVAMESGPDGLRAGNPQPFLQAQWELRMPAFSPDGKWMAYSSDESGDFQIYVVDFPAKSKKVLVSGSGGVSPLFAPTGNSLFFANMDNQLMLAPYSVRDGLLQVEKPLLWSDRHLSGTSVTARAYDITHDGRRVVAVMQDERLQKTNAINHIFFLDNFFDELRSRVPVPK